MSKQNCAQHRMRRYPVKVGLQQLSKQLAAVVRAVPTAIAIRESRLRSRLHISSEEIAPFDHGVSGVRVGPHGVVGIRTVPASQRIVTTPRSRGQGERGQTHWSGTPSSSKYLQAHTHDSQAHHCREAPHWNVPCAGRANRDGGPAIREGRVLRASLCIKRARSE